MTPPIPRVIAEDDSGARIWSLEVPLRGHPMGAASVYALELADSILLMDTGGDYGGTFDALEAGLARLGIRVGDIEGILISHGHSDHYGLVSRLLAAGDPWIATHSAEAEFIADRTCRQDALLERRRAWLAGAGVPTARRNLLLGGFQEVYAQSAGPRPTRLLSDGDLLREGPWEIEVLHTPGHTPGHLCYLERRTGSLFTGDHVLPEVTPNISLVSVSGESPMGPYLSSLNRLIALDPEPLRTLPGHQQAFNGPRSRLRELSLIHERRMVALKRLVDGGAAVIWNMSSQLNWRTPWPAMSPFAQRFAMGQVHAYLACLAERGQIHRFGDDPIRWTS